MDSSLTRKQFHELYYYMRLNRSLEDRLVNLFKQNKVVGGLYGSLGQEATSVGTAYALGPGDWIAPMIRNVGALLVRGYPPRDILTQYMARYTSPTLGQRRHQPLWRFEGAARGVADFDAGRFNSGDDRSSHGRKIFGTENCGHDLDRRRRNFHGRVPRGDESWRRCRRRPLYW